MVGCYRLGQWPTQNMTEDPNLEAYTLERFGIRRAATASSKLGTEPVINGTEERNEKTTSSEEVTAVSPSFVPQRIQVSESVMRPLLIEGEQPTWPPSAEQPEVAETVVLHAEISKSGTVEEVKLMSGHPSLAPAAIDAVKRWRYKPYIENGKPVEVETEITLPFGEKFISTHK